MIDGWVNPCEIAFWWISLNLTNDKSTLVQVMAWCRRATSHYLNQCWSRSVSPYGVTNEWMIITRQACCVILFVWCCGCCRVSVACDGARASATTMMMYAGGGACNECTSVMTFLITDKIVKSLSAVIYSTISICFKTFTQHKNYILST